MNDHTYLHCTWKEYIRTETHVCRKVGTECVVYGCLNGHVNEFIGCAQHFNLWVTMNADGKEPCFLRGCEAKIDSWERLAVYKLTPGFALYMKTRQ